MSKMFSTRATYVVSIKYINRSRRPLLYLRGACGAHTGSEAIGLSKDTGELSSPLSTNPGLLGPTVQQKMASLFENFNTITKSYPPSTISVSVFFRIMYALIIIDPISIITPEMMPPQIEDFVVGLDVHLVKTVDFTIPGDPKTQNGWKVRTTRQGRPIVYDEKSREKKALRMAIIKEFGDLNEPAPFFTETRLVVNIAYHIEGEPNRKDVDNMTKFLLDAMELAAYDNDKWIYDLHVTKCSSATPKTVVSIKAPFPTVTV